MLNFFFFIFDYEIDLMSMLLLLVLFFFFVAFDYYFEIWMKKIFFLFFSNFLNIIKIMQILEKDVDNIYKKKIIINKKKFIKMYLCHYVCSIKYKEIELFRIIKKIFKMNKR